MSNLEFENYRRYRVGYESNHGVKRAIRNQLCSSKAVVQGEWGVRKDKRRPLSILKSDVKHLRRSRPGENG